MYGQGRAGQAQARMQEEILSHTHTRTTARSHDDTRWLCCSHSQTVSMSAGEFCLLRCHNIDVARMTADERDRWVCPACHSLCYCAACQRYEKHRAAERATANSTAMAEPIVRDVTHLSSHSLPSGGPYQSLRIDTSPSSSDQGVASFHSSPLTPLAAVDYSLPSTPTAFDQLMAPIPPPRPSRALVSLVRSSLQRPPPLHLPVGSPPSMAAAAPLFSPVSVAGGGERADPFVPLLISRSSPHPFFTFPALFPAAQLFTAPPHCSTSRTYSWSEIQG